MSELAFTDIVKEMRTHETCIVFTPRKWLGHFKGSHSLLVN